MSENGGDAVGDSLRENMQMEKLKALRPMNVDSGPQQTRKPAAGRADTKEVAKDIQDEVDERVRDTERGKSTGAHCDTLIEQVKAAHASGATKSDFTPTTSSTPLEVRRRPARPAAASECTAPSQEGLSEPLLRGPVQGIRCPASLVARVAPQTLGGLEMSLPPFRTSHA